MNFGNLPIDETPIHVVMWKDASVFTTTSHSSQSEVAELKKRVEELERIVQRLISAEPVKANKSPFFKSTNVPEPVGMEVITNLELNESEESSVIDSPDVKEVFHTLTTTCSEAKCKQVTLNGMVFDIRNFGDDVVYCEENTGRAFLDPNDAFNEPNKKYIGYWNSQADTLSVRSESFSDDEEQVVEEIKKPIVEVKEETKKPVVEVKEEEEDEEEEEEEEEEEGVELEEFEYKGVSYYRDSDNQVYEANEEGEVDTDNAIGVWNEQKQKVLKYKV
jgi:hypothetical protein